jgi:hypothetical protein
VRAATLLLFLLALPAVVSAQPVPEGVHTRPIGPPSICGLTGSSIEDIRRQLIAEAGIEEVAAGELYYAYMQAEPKRAWAFTRAGQSAYPAVVCREILSIEGSTHIKMSIHCEASRESCDQLYRDFEALNERMKEEIAGRIR